VSPRRAGVTSGAGGLRVGAGGACRIGLGRSEARPTVSKKPFPERTFARKWLLTWYPPIGIEPTTYALRVKRGLSTGVHRLHLAQLRQGVGVRLVHVDPASSRVVVSIRVSTIGLCSSDSAWRVRWQADPDPGRKRSERGSEAARQSLPLGLLRLHWTDGDRLTGLPPQPRTTSTMTSCLRAGPSDSRMDES
jgi:hypothetical protein